MAAKPLLSFIYNPKIDGFRALGEALTAKYGGVPVDKADVLVPIGGDGSVLYALPLAKGRPVYGVVPEDCNSIAYTATDFAGHEDLYEDIAQSEKFPVHPLNIDITYEDGRRERLKAFSSFDVVRDGAQAAMMDLTANFNGAAKTLHVVGDGLAFHTPLGSTGQGYSNGGPIVPPTRPAMIFTPIAIGMPRGLNPIVTTAGESYDIQCITSKGKRPLRIDIDGNTVRPEAGNSFKSITVSISPVEGAVLAIKEGGFHPFKRQSLS